MVFFQMIQPALDKVIYHTTSINAFKCFTCQYNIELGFILVTYFILVNCHYYCCYPFWKPLFLSTNTDCFPEIDLQMTFVKQHITCQHFMF